MHIGDWIRAHREKRRPPAGARQSDLAQVVRVTEGTISRWERGLVIPTLQQFKALCRALGQSAQVLAELELERRRVVDDAAAEAVFRRGASRTARRKGSHGHGKDKRRRSAARRGA